MKKKSIKIILIILSMLLLIAVGLGFYVYSIFSTDFKINKTVYIYVDSSRNYDSILSQVEKSAKVANLHHFEQVASYFNYKDKIRTGKYAVKPDMTVKELVLNLINGKQTPVRVTFNNIRTKKDLTKRLSNQLMLSDEELYSSLSDTQKCADLGFDTLTVISMFIPDTYEFYWDVNLEAFLNKMNKQYNRFWNTERLNKAKELGLTPVQISVLASIVEEECKYSDEYPVVAGLYLNRLRKGMLLQADPTVKYAVGDFSLRRILNEHLKTYSPYNTYIFQGLPPGPIRIPSIRGIDAVLNYNQNNYLYMCAKEDFSGRHNFAQTLSQHNENANRYRAALNKRNIFK